MSETKQEVYDLTYTGKKYDLYSKIRHMNIKIVGSADILLGTLLEDVATLKMDKKRFIFNDSDNGVDKYDGILFTELLAPQHIICGKITNTIFYNNINIIKNINIPNNNNTSIDIPNNNNTSIDIPNNNNILLTNNNLNSYINKRENEINKEYEIKSIDISVAHNGISMSLETSIKNDNNDFVLDNTNNYKRKETDIKNSIYKNNINDTNYLYKFNKIIKHVSKKLYKSIKKNNPSKYIYYANQIKQISLLPGVTTYLYHNNNNKNIGTYKTNLLDLLLKGNVVGIITFFNDYKKLIKILYKFKYEFIFSIFINDVIDIQVSKAYTNQVLNFFMELMYYFTLQRCNFIHYVIYPKNTKKYNHIIDNIESRIYDLINAKNLYINVLKVNMLLNAEADTSVTIYRLLYDSIISENVELFNKNLSFENDRLAPNLIIFAVTNIILLKKEKLINSVHNKIKHIIEIGTIHIQLPDTRVMPPPGRPFIPPPISQPMPSFLKNKIDDDMPLFIYTIPLFSAIFRIFINVIGYKNSLLTNMFEKTKHNEFSAISTYYNRLFIKIPGNVRNTNIDKFEKYLNDNLYEFRYSKNELYPDSGVEIADDAFLSSIDIASKILDNEIMFSGFEKIEHTFKKCSDISAVYTNNISRTFELILYYKHFSNNAMIKMFNDNFESYIKKNIIDDIPLNSNNNDLNNIKKRKPTDVINSDSSDSDETLKKNNKMQKKLNYKNSINKTSSKSTSSSSININHDSSDSDSSEDEKNKVVSSKNELEIKIQNIKNNFIKIINMILNIVNNTNITNTIEGNQIMNELFSEHVNSNI